MCEGIHEQVGFQGKQPQRWTGQLLEADGERANEAGLSPRPHTGTIGKEPLIQGFKRE